MPSQPLPPATFDELGYTGGQTPVNGQVIIYNGSVYVPGRQKSYEHDQGPASATWVIIHNFGYSPASVRAVDTGGIEIVGQVEDVDNNTLTIKFNASFSGKAFIS